MMDKRVHDLEQRVQEAMALPQGHRVHFTDLHDALTTMRFHGKSIPEVCTCELLSTFTDMECVAILSRASVTAAC